MQDSVRWRLNAGGIEWFFNGRWYPCVNDDMTHNLVTQIDYIASSYGSGHNPILDINPFDFSNLI